MSKCIIHHCDFMMLMYHELQSSAEVVRAFKKIFSNHLKSNEMKITWTIEKFKVTGSVLDDVKMMKTKEKSARTTENIEKSERTVWSKSINLKEAAIKPSMSKSTD